MEVTKHTTYNVYATSDQSGVFDCMLLIPRKYIISEEEDEEHGTYICKFIDQETGEHNEFYFLDKMAIMVK